MASLSYIPGPIFMFFFHEFKLNPVSNGKSMTAAVMSEPFLSCASVQFQCSEKWNHVIEGRNLDIIYNP